MIIYDLSFIKPKLKLSLKSCYPFDSNSFKAW